MLERVWCILLRQGEVPFRYEDVWTFKFSKRGLSQIQFFESTFFKTRATLLYRPYLHHVTEIWKRCFISPVRPSVQTNPEKLSTKTLLKPEEFEHGALRFIVDEKMVHMEFFWIWVSPEYLWSFFRAIERCVFYCVLW